MNAGVSWLRNGVRILLFLVLSAVTLVVLAYSWLSYAGRRDWARAKQELIARGEKLSLAELAPKPIPDSENFFADPLWAELADTVPAKNRALFLDEPMVPEGQRMLDAIDPPLSPELREHALKLLPALRTNPAAELKSLDVCDTAYRSIVGLNPGAQTRELSQLIVEVSRQSEPLRNHIESLLARPGAVIANDSVPASSVPFKQAEYVVKFVRLYSSLAEAYFRLGEFRASAEYVSKLSAIARVIGREHLIYTVITREMIVLMMEKPIQMGIREHCWTDDELARFEQGLKDWDLVYEFSAALRRERAAANEFIALALNDHSLPAPYGPVEAGETFKDFSSIEKAIASYGYPFTLVTDQASYNLGVQRLIDWIEGLEADTEAKSPEVYLARFPMRGFHPLSVAAVPRFRSFVFPIVAMQNEAAETRIACALERFRIARGAYPQLPKELIPAYLTGVPRDVVGNRQFTYRLKTDGSFSLDARGLDGSEWAAPGAWSE